MLQFVPAMPLQKLVGILLLCLLLPERGTEKELVPLTKLQSEHLPNLIYVVDRVYSGGLPEDETAFQELQELGIRTIISVDGATPNVHLAEKYSMRYIHLPHGYDGISTCRSKQIAKAIKTLEGPFYIHCHHGRHRSPAATAVACKTLGLMSQDQANRLLHLAGTDPKYKGLYRDVQAATRIDDRIIEQLQVTFTSAAELPPMAHAMIEIEEHFESLRKSSQSQWSSVSHGKRSPQQSALLLQEQFSELMRMDDNRIKSAEFIRICQQSEQAAHRIEKLLRQSDRTSATILNLDQLLGDIASDCKSCHDAIRNR